MAGETNLKLASIKSTIGSTSRTLGARFSDVKNVKDFGAVGDSTNGTDGTDDAAAIQAAIDYTTSPYSSQKRGIVYFPPGFYRTSTALTWETSSMNVAFVGAPGARLYGNYSDAVLKRSVNSPINGVHFIEGLEIYNLHATGKGIMAHSCIPVTVKDCAINAWRGIETYNSQAANLISCAFVCPDANAASSVGIMAGNATAVIGCDVSGYKHGIRHQNVGLEVLGGRYEVNDKGIVIGQDETGSNFTSAGVHISGLSMEANQTGIELGPCAGVNIGGVSMGGGVSMVCGINITSGSHIVLSGISISGALGFSTAGVKIANNLDSITCLGVNSASATAWSLGTGRTKSFIRSSTTTDEG